MIVIPGELYARAWLRPLRRRRARGAPPAAGRASAMTMTTIERVVALQRVDAVRRRPGPDARRRRAAGAEVEVAAGTTVIAEGAVEDHLFAVVAGRLRVHHGERTVADLGAGLDRRRARRARARAALGVGHRARADDCCCGSTSPCSTSCSPTGPRSRAGSSPRSSRWSASGPRPRPTRRPRDRHPPAPSGGRALADAAVAGLRRDGRAARDRRQRDVPRGLRLGVAAGDVHRDRRGRVRGVGRRSRGSAQRFDLDADRASSCWAAPRSRIGGCLARSPPGGDGAWVSAPLLVLFPILIQLGFVFIGGQAGRILDIAGIKASFPRIMAGVPGRGGRSAGLLGGQLVTCSGRTEDLLLATARRPGERSPRSCWATGRRYAGRSSPARGRRPHDDRARRARPTTPPRRSSLRRLLASRFVALILGLPGPVRPGQPALRLPRLRPGGRPVPRDRRPRPASWPATPRS